MAKEFVPLAAAAKVAQTFLSIGRYDCENPDPNRPQLTGEYHKIRLFSELIAYLFPLERGHQASGFLIISGDRAFAPILDYCTSGPNPKLYFDSFLRTYWEDLGRPVRFVDYIYFGPFDFIAEIHFSDGSTGYSRLPNFHYLDKWNNSGSLSPNILQDETKVRIQWEMYLRDDFPIPGFECSKMFGWAPVPYNQTCHSASEKLRTKSSINYCSPNCIAGCSPVAWMVLANAFRGFDYSRFPLLSDASDWHVPWESSYGGPPKAGSKVVNNRLWELHDYMSTDCFGSTDADYIQSGRHLFNIYNLNWKWGLYDQFPYGYSRAVNKGGLAYLLSAQSNWTGSGSEGHSFVVRGFNDNTEHIYVSLGWGSAFPDRWIPYSMLADPSAVYVSSFSATEDESKEIAVQSKPASYVEDASDGEEMNAQEFSTYFGNHTR